jgi:trehalose/maltose transport system substrate-binding protein
LSIFRGSFTLAAAQAVTGDTLTMLISLVDKSLLRQVMPERYAIHPVHRRFAEEKLAEMPGERERTRSRCYDYYAVFLQEKTEVLYKGQEVTDTLTAINAELENLWAVWRWDLAQDEAHKFGEVLDRMWLAINWNEFFIVGDPHVTFDEHRQWLESQSSVLRMIHIDLIWLDALAEYLQDLSYTLNEEARQHFPVYVDNCRAYGKLVALPYFANVALLYYRADLLQNYGYASPPTTWDDLENMATTIQAGERAKGHTSFWGYVWQGKNYEGLTCNALEWQVSQGGGGLIEPDGLISVNNPQAIAAFERAARWVGTISPVEVTNYNEWDSWKVWLDGNAAFIHNWGVRFYDPADMLVGKDAFGVTRLPIGQAGHAATLGGSCIAIPAHTQYLQEALALTRLATKHDAQKQRALAHPFYPPTNPALYDDPEVLAVNPHFSTLKSALTQDAILRPSKITGKLYPQVSEAYFTAVHSILTGQVDAATAVADLETQLVEITGFEVGRPGRTTTNCDFNEFALS